MDLQRIAWTVFAVEEAPEGGFRVCVAEPIGTGAGAVRVAFTLDAEDRHAADTMAAMFNRVVRTLVVTPVDRVQSGEPGQ